MWVHAFHFFSFSFPTEKIMYILVALIIQFLNSPRITNYDWDYRWMEYPAHARISRHPNDRSLATYRDHSVLRTLIRCYFSPAYR